MLEYLLSEKDLEIAGLVSKLTASVVIPFLLTTMFIAYKDLSGSWEKYRIAPRPKDDPWKDTPLKKYWYFLPYTCRDLLFVLPLFTFLYIKYVNGQYEALTQPFEECNILK
jgi:hypothetical protein